MPHCEVEKSKNKNDEKEIKSKNKLENEIIINASPNPSNGKFNIELKNVGNKHLKVLISDINGKSLFESDLFTTEYNEQSLNIDLSKHSNGIYII